MLGRVFRRFLAADGSPPRKIDGATRIREGASVGNAFHSNLNRGTTVCCLHPEGRLPRLDAAARLSPENVSAFHGQTPDF